MIGDFLKGESGAVTVDWVVMTAATVALGLAVMAEIREGVEAASQNISDQLSNTQIRTSFAEWDAFRAEAGTAAQSDESSSD